MIKKGLLFTIMFCILFSCNTSMQAISQKYVRGAITTIAAIVGSGIGLQGKNGGFIGNIMFQIKPENVNNNITIKRIISSIICAVLLGSAVYFESGELFKTGNVIPK